MQMPFGKYKGISLEFINSGYLKWLLDQDFFLNRNNGEEALAVEKELELRDMYNSHFYKDKVKA